MIGNAAAEAHPIIGEGISMAMQSAWFLCERLIAVKRADSSANALQRVGASYASQWRQAFSRRLHLAATLAHLAMRPSLAPLVWPILGRTPRLMTAVARGAGKTRIPPSLEHVPPLRGLTSLEDAH